MKPETYRHNRTSMRVTIVWKRMTPTAVLFRTRSGLEIEASQFLQYFTREG